MIEVFSLVTPLGLRFWDDVRQSAVGDGLVVETYPADNTNWRKQALVNQSSVYAFPHLPGLGSFEMGNGNADFWSAPPAKLPFIVEVKDLDRRFLPFSFRLRLPVRGVWEFECESVDSPPVDGSTLDSPPGLRPRGVPLFSSAGRRPVPGMAVVRADLAESHDKAAKPAPWVLIELLIDNKLVARGLSDNQGHAMMMFPYPEPPDFAPDSPFAQRKPLQDQKWTVEARAYYERKSEVPDFPDLCDLVHQPLAVLWDDATGSVPLASRELRYGEELVLQSGLQPALLITAVGSPL